MSSAGIAATVAAAIVATIVPQPEDAVSYSPPIPELPNEPVGLTLVPSRNANTRNARRPTTPTMVTKSDRLT